MARKPSSAKPWSPQGILRATQELRGGTRDKDGKVTPFTLSAGRRLDRETAEKLGLDEAALLKLLAQGAIVEHPGEEGDGRAAAAPADFDGISRADLAATLKAQGVAVQPDDDIETLLGAALAHGVPQA